MARFPYALNAKQTPLGQIVKLGIGERRSAELRPTERCRDQADGFRQLPVWTATLNFSPTDRWPSPVEGAALEMPYSRKAVLGSNPNLSATR